jgi:glycine/D-amino acid oxidase-like deaminating enzyme
LQAFGGSVEIEAGVFTLWPARVVRGLARAASSVKFVTGCDVSKIELLPSSAPDGSAAVLPVALHTSKGRLLCSRVVVATNGWLPKLLPELSPHCRAVTNTVVISEEAIHPGVDGVPAGWGKVATVASGKGSAEVYICRRGDGRLVMGGLRSPGGDPSAGAGDDDTDADPVVATALRSWFTRHFPTLGAKLGFSRAWRGVIGVTSDGLPLVGPMARGERFGTALATSSRGDNAVWVCGGFSGHGMPQCYGVAEIVAKQLCGVLLDPMEATVAAACNVRRFSPAHALASL